MSHRRVVTAVGALLTFALISCDDTRTPTAEDPDGEGPGLGLSGDWQLISGRHEGRELEVQPRYPVTLSVDDEDGNLTAGGQSACNTYGATLDVSGDELSINDLESTVVGCAEPVLSLETSYHSALANVTAYEQTPDRLVLIGSDSTLTFTPLPTNSVG